MTQCNYPRSIFFGFNLEDSLLQLIHPVDDIWYYLPMIVSIVMLLLSAVSMIQLSNMRSSHMITHFASHTGGFDAAYDEE